MSRPASFRSWLNLVNQAMSPASARTMAVSVGPSPGILRNHAVAGSGAVAATRAGSRVAMRARTAVTRAARAVNSAATPGGSAPGPARGPAPLGRGQEGPKGGREGGDHRRREQGLGRGSQGGPERILPARLAGPGPPCPPKEPDEAAEGRDRLVGECAEEHARLVQEVAEIVGVLGIVLVPGPIEEPAMERGDMVVHEEHVGPVGVEALYEGLVVGAGGLQGHDDLGHPGGPPVTLQAAPEGARSRPWCWGWSPSDSRIRVWASRIWATSAALATSIPTKSRSRFVRRGSLQLAKPLDSVAVSSHAGHGAPPSGG